MRFLLIGFSFLVPFLDLAAIDFDEAAQEIVDVGVFLSDRDLCPATSGNCSRRIDDRYIAVTVTGKHKGELTTDDVIVVDLNGNPARSAKRPSAETLLHSAVYIAFPEAHAVVHTHSLNGTVLTRLVNPDKTLVTDGYEIHKALPGIKTHNSQVKIPIFENNQNIAALSTEVVAYLKEHPEVSGFLIRGHGFYTWGKDMNEVKVRVEAYEYLFESELKFRMATRGR
ncbi:MAG: methylthioribulose 1-phosphate dehydratase [Verrucomicrobia bacterium]|nr:methylthioribulose 1-phosphate dehydratase [Verrucomicrobiota bacterium]